MEKRHLEYNRPRLLGILATQRSQPEKMRDLIIYAIEEQELSEESSIRSLLKTICEDFRQYIFISGTVKSRFESIYGPARQSLINEGLISRIAPEPNLYSIRIRLLNELKAVINALKEARESRKIGKINRLLEELSSLADKQHITQEKGVLEEIYQICQDEDLFRNRSAIGYAVPTLGNIVRFLSQKQPKKYEEILNDINERHIKLICRKIKEIDDIEIIRNIILNLFGYVKSEEVVYTLFELVEDLPEQIYQHISYTINTILFFIDGHEKYVLFDNFESLIRDELFRLMDHEDQTVSQRAGFLNARRIERYKCN